MTYEFRHQLRYAITVLLLASLVVSCSTNDILSSPDTDSPEIDFSTPALSRGIITSSDDMSAFDVWGWYSPTTGNGAQTQVFEARKVTNTGSGWKYDIPERWQQGNTYRFYAVYPSKEEDPKYKSASYNESGNLAITNFDCSYAVDLMTASKEIVCYDNGYPGKVNMTFSHELARVLFIAKNHSGAQNIIGYKPFVKSSKLYGMYKTGSLNVTSTGSVWTIPANSGETATDKNSPLAKAENKDVTSVDGVTIIEVLVFPQQVKVGYSIDLVYTTDDSNPIEKQTTIDLSSLSVDEWIAGKQYRYSFTITPDDRILFDKPTVNKWDEATGGIIIVE